MRSVGFSSVDKVTIRAGSEVSPPGDVGGLSRIFVDKSDLGPHLLTERDGLLQHHGLFASAPFPSAFYCDTGEMVDRHPSQNREAVWAYDHLQTVVCGVGEEYPDKTVLPDDYSTVDGTVIKAGSDARGPVDGLIATQKVA